VPDLGLLTATKQLDVENKTGAVILVLFGGANARWAKNSETEVTVNVSELGNQVQVRANFSLKVIDNKGGVVDVKQIQEQAYYQEFFLEGRQGHFPGGDLRSLKASARARDAARHAGTRSGTHTGTSARTGTSTRISTSVGAGRSSRKSANIRTDLETGGTAPAGRRNKAVQPGWLAVRHCDDPFQVCRGRTAS